MKIYEKLVKRIIDIIFAFSALVILCPVLIITALLVRFRIGSPILFKQKRPGLHEKVFTLYKFRTMTNERNEKGELLPDHVRLTRFGRFLRSTSLDELPQLINIIKGDLSIIGPRPLLVSYLPLYNDEQRKRHNVRPGLVGLAGVRGRNAQGWDEKFKSDIEYVNNISFIMDLKIFVLAIITVLKRSGVNQDGEVTASAFYGNNESELKR